MVVPGRQLHLGREDLGRKELRILGQHLPRDAAGGGRLPAIEQVVPGGGQALPPLGIDVA